MSSLEKLKQALEEEAAAEIETIRVDTEQKVATIKARAEAEAEEVEADILASARKETDEVARRAEAEANLTRRRIMLRAKGELVNEVMRKASDMLVRLPEDRYRAFLVRLLMEAAPTAGSCEVVFNERDRTSIGKSVLAEVGESLRKKGYRVSLTIASQPGTMSGGFRLVGSDSEVDSTFERLLHMASESYEPEIARILFEESR